MSRFAYFPGCSLHATAREYDESIRALAGRLDFDLHEIEDWCCCGATPAHAIDAESARLLGLWNLAHAAKGGKAPLLTGCAACFSRLRAVRAEARLGLTIDPDLEVLHIAQALAAEPMRERVRAAIVRPLGRLPVACYYGCLLTRPRGPGAVDDAEDPHLLEDLVHLAGAEPVAWPLRLDCCGASMTLPRPDLVHALSGKILAGPKEIEAIEVLTADQQTDPARVRIYRQDGEPAAPQGGEPWALYGVPGPDRPAREQWEFWTAEFARCLRCNACREPCPLCACVRCVTDKTRPRWIDASPTPAGNWLWNVTRAFHQAGRCVDCGACTDACPAGIPLHALNLAMARAPGAAGRRSPLLSYRTDDQAPFIM